VEGTQTLSLAEAEQGEALDNHHPGISADGRYVTYLESSPTNEASCSVHILDYESEDYVRLPCTAGLTRAAAAAPYFSAEGRTIEWVVEEVPGVELSRGELSIEVYVVDNPLAEGKIGDTSRPD